MRSLCLALLTALLLHAQPVTDQAHIASIIRQELDAHHIPSIAIAVVTPQRILYAQGFGYADPKQLTPATADTMYRVGELSELVTLRGIRAAQIDFNAPVKQYLPGFPHADITIRDLAEHESGLVREAPVGNTYDRSAPTLAATVDSLQRVPLSNFHKHSDAGIAILGRVLELKTGQPFAAYMQTQVLAPLGMTRSSFVASPTVRDALAKGTLWAFDRAPWEAPVFDIGAAPALNLYSSANEMARLLMALLNDKPRVGDIRNTSLQGFSATLLYTVAPTQHAVIVLASKDNATSVTQNIARLALHATVPRAGQWPERPAADPPHPPAASAALQSLIGEYGPEDNPVFLFERDGRLHALVRWVEDNTLTVSPAQPSRFRMPIGSRYSGESLSITGSGLTIGESIHLAKRDTGGKDAVFRIQPVRPVAQLRAEAEKLSPPKEAGVFRPQELVDLTTLDPTIKLDIRYAGTNNFLSTPSYTSARAFLQRPAATALLQALQTLQPQGFGLLIHDAYRPWTITKVFWDATPPAQHEFVADPAKGSKHNRGCAVDLTLYDLKTGQPVEMTGEYDEMTDRSYPFYPGGTSAQRWRRDVLRRAMEGAGFTVEPSEWWHFNYHDWPFYRIGNESFEELTAKRHE